MLSKRENCEYRYTITPIFPSANNNNNNAYL